MAVVLMPEATIDQNYCAIFSENHIRLARQALMVQAISEALAVQTFSNQELRSGVDAPDTRHHSGSCLFVDNINH